MPQRRSTADDWESLFARMQELVMANSGEDEFGEIFKLIIAKLYDEKHSHDGARFQVYRSAQETEEAINRLIASAAAHWRGIFPDAPRSKLSAEHVTTLVRMLEPHRLADSQVEVLDNVFEHLTHSQWKGNKGQFFTPRHVIEACTRIVRPRCGEFVADPASGSGGFLVHALNYVRAHDPDEGYEQKFWGFDFDARAVQVARALMLVAGCEQPKVFRTNSLVQKQPRSSTDPTNSDGVPTIEEILRSSLGSPRGNFHGFDVILTNPPFAGEVRDKALLDSYELASADRVNERDILFLERCVELLRPGGRLGIVLPHNTLSSGRWAFARRWFLQRMRIVAVLGLGRNTFLPHTHQKASVVFATKRHQTVREFRDEEILFLISQKDGKDSKGKIIAREGASSTLAQWEKVDHDLDEAVQQFDDFVTSNDIDWGRQPCV